MFASSSFRFQAVTATALAISLTALPVGAFPITEEAAANYLFEGVAVEWRWTVHGDATLEDGNHLDTGHLSIAALCFSEGPCEGEMTFVGALGTATCRVTDGVVSGTMSLYAGVSFDCATLSMSIDGAPICTARLDAEGAGAGVHSLAGAGGGAGACVAQ